MSELRCVSGDDVPLTLKRKAVSDSEEEKINIHTQPGECQQQPGQPVLTVDYPIFSLNLSHRVGFTLNCLEPLVQLARFGFLLFLVQIYPFLDTLSNQTGLLLGLPRPLAAPGYLQCLTPGFR